MPDDQPQTTEPRPWALLCLKGNRIGGVISPELPKKEVAKFFTAAEARMKVETKLACIFAGMWFFAGAMSMLIVIALVHGLWR